MDSSINSNIPQINSLRQLAASYRRLEKNSEKQSSGQRINVAADDPAGLVISERTRAQVTSLEQEIENTEASMDKYRIADGTLSSLQETLTRMRALALANLSSARTNDGARNANADEFARLHQSFNEQVASTEYNGAKLFDGTEHAVADVNELENLDISSSQGSAHAADYVDGEIFEISSTRGEIGARMADDLERTRSSLQITLANLGAAESTIRDSDVAREHADMVRNLLLQNSAVAALSHGRQAAQTVLSLL